MSHKHKRRGDDEKYVTSRVNVFDRLGEGKKERVSAFVY